MIHGDTSGLPLLLTKEVPFSVVSFSFRCISIRFLEVIVVEVDTAVLLVMLSGGEGDGNE